jgi:heptosyltransferase-3
VHYSTKTIVQKILVIKLRHHGDVLLSTALPRALVQQWPGVAVDMLVYAETLPLLDNNPDLHQVLCINRRHKSWSRLRAEWQLLRQVANAGYDAVVHLTDQWVGAVLARASGAPVRIGLQWGKRDHALWRGCFTNCLPMPPRGSLHAVELNALCLPALGVKPPPPLQVRFAPSLAASASVAQRLQRAGLETGDFVVVHPAARWAFKCWEDERFAAVVARVQAMGWPVVLTCSPDAIETDMVAHIAKLAEAIGPRKNQAKPPILNWGGQLSLPELGALLANARAYIGVDSAPMHMAAALDVPQVALFGPSWLNEWRPWSNKAEVVYAGDFGPLPHPDSINTDNPTRLLVNIPTEAVLAAVERILGI